MSKPSIPATMKDHIAILDAEIARVRDGKILTERTNAVVKTIGLKLSYVRFAYRVFKETGVPQDLGGMLNTKPVIEGTTSGKRRKVAQLRAA